MLPRFLPSRCFGYVGQLVVFPSDSQWRGGVEISANNIELFTATTTNLDGAGNSSHSVPSSSRRPLDDEIYFFCRTFLRREPSHLEQSTFFFDLLQFCGLPSAGIWLRINKWVLMALARGKSSDKWDFILFNRFVAIPQMRSFNMENLKLGRGLFGSNFAINWNIKRCSTRSWLKVPNNVFLFFLGKFLGPLNMVNIQFKTNDISAGSS